MCIYIYTYTHTHTCTYIYMYIHIYIHTHTHTHTYMYKSHLFEVAVRRRHHAAGAHQRLGDDSGHLVPKF
jgi:hypothetical protein